MHLSETARALLYVSVSNALLLAPRTRQPLSNEQVQARAQAYQNFISHLLRPLGDLAHQQSLEETGFIYI